MFDAAGADSTGIKRVPFVAAGAAPHLVAGRFPLTEGAPDTRAGEAGTSADFLVGDDVAHSFLIQDTRAKFPI